MKIRMNLFDMIINILCIIMIIGVGVYLFIIWGEIPEQMPAQYNLSGEVSRWAGKNEILFMPALALFMFVFITVIELFPRIWNIPVRVTAANIGRVYRMIKNMIGCIKFFMTAMFVSIPVFQAKTMSIPGGFIFSLVGVLFIVIIGHIVAIARYR